MHAIMFDKRKIIVVKNRNSCIKNYTQLFEIDL